MDKLEILISKKEIAAAVRQLAAKITTDYKDSQPLLAVCILKGSCVFFADLIRELDLDVRLDFMAVSSYGAGKTSSGEVRLLKDLDDVIDNKHVLIVEDIMDSGITLQYLKKLLLSRNPASIRICALLDKPASRKTDIEADYKGITIPDSFVVGYGLDCNQKYRNLPDICILSQD